MQIWAESGKSALPICNYSQILYQFLTFTQNLKRSQKRPDFQVFFICMITYKRFYIIFLGYIQKISLSLENPLMIFLP